MATLLEQYVPRTLLIMIPQVGGRHTGQQIVGVGTSPYGHLRTGQTAISQILGGPCGRAPVLAMENMVTSAMRMVDFMVDNDLQIAYISYAALFM
jgi:hypothetical protein